MSNKQNDRWAENEYEMEQEDQGDFEKDDKAAEEIINSKN